MRKTVFYTELSYVIGLIVLAIGTAFMEKANFGLSMVVAPAYLLHLKISEFLPFFSFGMAEYTFQALLFLLTMLLMRRAKLSYLFSLVTAVIYGFLLDGFMALVSFIPEAGFPMRVIFYVVGTLACTAAIALLFRTYIPPEAYELFVKEVSTKYGIDIHKFKMAYDCASCILSVVMSFAFFGLWSFTGINWGTMICALVNGPLIAQFSKIFGHLFSFEDRLPLKKYF